MMLHRDVIMNPCSQEETENLANLANQIFGNVLGREITSSEFNYPSDTEADEVAKEYKLYKSYLDLCDTKMESETIEAFCKYIISDKEFTILNGTGFMYYKSLLEYTLELFLHTYDFDVYKRLVHSSGFSRTKNLSYIRKDIIKCEKIYNGIYAKKTKRLLKKNLAISK
jgi:hypothetical protein